VFVAWVAANLGRTTAFRLERNDSVLGLSARLQTLRSVRSFEFLDEICTSKATTGAELTIINWSSPDPPNVSFKALSRDASLDGVRKTILPCFDMLTWNASGLTKGNLTKTLNLLEHLYGQFDAEAVVIRLSERDHPHAITTLIRSLTTHEIPVLVMADHDMACLEAIPFDCISGLIVESACILPDGNRRDYFRSAPLRNVMAKCAAEREVRPELFIGFLDMWNVRPSATDYTSPDGGPGSCLPEHLRHL
jgi:hypothetical protein